jgi:hypothetical protein
MVVPSEYEIAEGKNTDRSTYSTHFLPQLSHLPLEARKENLFTNVLKNTDLRFSFLSCQFVLIVTLLMHVHI